MKFRSKKKILMVFIACCLIFSCRHSRSSGSNCNDSRLFLLSSYHLEIPEPSGLTINESGTFLWIVSDENGRIYKLDTTGNVLDILDYEGDDLEGIAYDPFDATLWVVEEGRREVVHLDINGNVLQRKQLPLAGPLNSGLEGICLDDSGNKYVLNEKHPGLFIELNKDLSIKIGHPLHFADDYSDLAYSKKHRCFWVLSDKNRVLFLWDRKNGVVREYVLHFPKAEGVAVNESANRLYIVSDSLNMLYVYRTE